MQIDIQSIGDFLAVPFFAMSVCYFSSLKKRGNIENILLLLAIGGLIFDLYVVVQRLKKDNNIYPDEFEEYTDQDQPNQPNQPNQPQNQEDLIEYFVPSETFQGKLDDYVFTTRDEGTGYYFDGENQ